jgi:hypothetical protein
VARGISGIIFENLRVFLKIHGPQLDFTERQGVICKYSRDFSGVELFFNWKFGGLGPPFVDPTVWLRSMVFRGGADKRARCSGARAHWC